MPTACSERYTCAGASNPKPLVIGVGNGGGATGAIAPPPHILVGWARICFRAVREWRVSPQQCSRSSYAYASRL